MTVPKVPQKTITQTIDAVQWAVSGDDAEAAAETRKRARQCGPDAVAFLHYVLENRQIRIRHATCARGERAVGSG